MRGGVAKAKWGVAHGVGLLRLVLLLLLVGVVAGDVDLVAGVLRPELEKAPKTIVSVEWRPPLWLNGFLVFLKRTFNEVQSGLCLAQGSC